MNKKEIQDIIEILKDVIYPQVIDKDFEGEDIVKEYLEDMTCIFRVETNPKNNFYLKLKLKEILDERGYNVHDVAFKNYRRDLRVTEHKVSHHGKNGNLELTLIYGTFNMGAVLFCKDLLEEIKSFYGSDYMILGVLSEVIILISIDEEKSVSFLEEVRVEIQEELKETFLSRYIFMYRNRVLVKC